MVTASSARSLSAQLLAWYDVHRRHLPWRAPPGRASDPYHVWLSEIMLQQTTVKAVIPYFNRFLVRWPSIADLAAAPLDEILAEWAGLGYYARARNLHKCANRIVACYGGAFPDSEAVLRDLPGIGIYTAAAIAAIAFDRPATPVDGNVERVTARLHAVAEPLPSVRPRLRALAAALTPAQRSGDYAQAVMDLGATVCTPRQPNCAGCPWSGSCAAHRAGLADTLPRRAPRAARPTRYGVAFWCIDGHGHVLLRRRPPDGLLGGMLEVPTSAWLGDEPSGQALSRLAPVVAEWRELPGVVRHGFTHFNLELRLLAGRIDRSAEAAPEGIWHPVAQLDAAGLPTVMAKVARHALGAGGGGA